MSHTAASPTKPLPSLADPTLGRLTLLLVAILAVRVVGLALSKTDLYFDEAQYWAWSREPGFGYYTKPPLIAWLIGATTSVCGDTPFCVRLPGPVLHFVSAFLIYATALRLFDRRTAFVAGLLYALMPGLSLSATLMSTDVPLLFFWTFGLYCIVRHVEAPSLGWGIALGLAIGLGLNAKYAMIYLPACFLLYGVAVQDARRALLHPGSLVALLVAAALIAPNVIWNMHHSFATFGHTEDNIGWGGRRFPNLGSALEFVAAQFGIGGPIVVFAFLAALAAPGRAIAASPRRLLLFHSLPVFAIILAQALIAKANGNWAATGFPAAVILGAAVMVAGHARKGIAWSLTIGVAALVAFSFYGAFAGSVTSGPLARQYAKLTGYTEFAGEVRRIATEQKLGTVVFTGRTLTSSMLYELRDTGLTVKAYLATPGHPADHFEMTRPFLPTDPGPALLVTLGASDVPEGVAARAMKIAHFATTIDIARHDGFQAGAYRVD